MMIKKLSKLEGEKLVLPDVELFSKSLLVACLGRGQSEIHPVPDAGIYASLIQMMKGLGYDIQRDKDALRIQGAGFQFVPHFENLSALSLWPSLNPLLLVLLSFHFPTASVRCNPSEFYFLKKCLPWLQLRKDEDQLFWQPVVDYEFAAEVIYQEPVADVRDALVLQVLLSGRALKTTEPFSPRDSLLNLLLQAGAFVHKESTGLNLEDLDEVERRMLRKRGVKTERKSIWSWSPTLVLKPIKVHLGADLTVASALSFAATLIPGSSIEIKNVCANPSRAGFVSSLKKLGAQIEWLHKKERAGETFASLKVKSVKQLQGRKISAENVLSQGLELGILCALAVQIPEEVILRDLPLWMSSSNRLENTLVPFLRQTGVEVGIYEEGLIFQGREQLDGGDWNLGGDLFLNLCFQLLSLKLHGKSNFEGLLDLQEIWPELWELFEGAQDAKNT